MEDFFRQLADDAPRWNFIWMYDDRQQGKVLAGLWMTIKLSVMCLVFSVIIGLVGAWMQGSRSAWVRALVAGYIQFFRNTPPLVQLLFFYFALGQFDSRNILTSLVMMPLAVLSVLAGVAIVKRIRAEVFYPIMYTFILIVSTKLIYDGVVGLIGG